jgi:hypothetical protein
MRESALFGTMFGLGAGAVLVGVTVSRLVVGQPPEKPAEAPSSVARETAPAVAAETPRPAQVQSPPSPVVSSAVEPPKAARPRESHAPRKHLRPPAVVEASPTTAPVVQETPSPPVVQQLPSAMAPVVQEPPPTRASVPNREALAAESPALEVRDTPIASPSPVVVVRGGAARPGSRAPGARVIQVEPQDAAR